MSIPQLSCCRTPETWRLSYRMDGPPNMTWRCAGRSCAGLCRTGLGCGIGTFSSSISAAGDSLVAGVCLAAGAGSSATGCGLTSGNVSGE